MYYSLLCALNGAGTDCLQLPVAAQLILIILLWPWVAAVRVIGAEQIALGSVLGFVLSLVWVFGVTCLCRWMYSRTLTRVRRVHSGDTSQSPDADDQG